MSDEEEDRFEKEQQLLNQNFNKIPHTPSAWEADIYDIDEDPNPHGKNINNFGDVCNIILLKSLIFMI